MASGLAESPAKVPFVLVKRTGRNLPPLSVQDSVLWSKCYMKRSNCVFEYEYASCTGINVLSGKMPITV